MPKEGKAKVLTKNELHRIIKIVSTKNHAKRNIALLYVSFGLGLRVKEIASLNINHIMNKNKTFHEVINLTSSMTKGDNQRHVYLTNPKIKKALQVYLNEREKIDVMPLHPCAPLFRSQKKQRFSPNALQQVFSNLYKQAGIIGASSHSGRRTFATRLIENGVDIKAVSRLMGHRSISMTAKYVEDNPIRLKRISEKFQF